MFWAKYAFGVEQTPLLDWTRTESHKDFCSIEPENFELQAGKSCSVLDSNSARLDSKVICPRTYSLSLGIQEFVRFIEVSAQSRNNLRPDEDSYQALATPRSYAFESTNETYRYLMSSLKIESCWEAPLFLAQVFLLMDIKDVNNNFSVFHRTTRNIGPESSFVFGATEKSAKITLNGLGVFF